MKSPYLWARPPVAWPLHWLAVEFWLSSGCEKRCQGSDREPGKIENLNHNHVKYSCINIYAHGCLKPLSNQGKAIFKQLKPCSSRRIHVLFEHSFYLKILKTDRGLFAWHYVAKCCRQEWAFCVCFCWHQRHVRKCILMFDFANWCHFVQQDSKYKMQFFNDFLAFSGAILNWNQVKCQNGDHTCLFHCMNVCQVPRKVFEHSACGLMFKQFPQDPANVDAYTLNCFAICYASLLLCSSVVIILFAQTCLSENLGPLWYYWQTHKKRV